MYISNKLQETLEILGVRVQEGINFIAQIQWNSMTYWLEEFACSQDPRAIYTNIQVREALL